MYWMVYLFSFYCLGFPQFEQNLPVFSVPHAQTHFPAASGFGLPQFEQNLPLFSVPHLPQIHTIGFALPQFEQKLPVFSVPQEHFHTPFAASCCACCRLLLHLLLIRSGRRCKRGTEGIHVHLNTHKAVHGSVWVDCCFLHTACHRSLYIALTDRWIRHHRTFVAHLDQFLGSFIVGKACDCHGLDLHAAHCPPALIHRICHVAGQLGALGCCERNADAVGCHLIDRGLQAL